MGHAVAKLVEACATIQKVAGSIPDGLIAIFDWRSPSGRTMALVSAQPLTEMSTSYSWCAGTGSNFLHLGWHILQSVTPYCSYYFWTTDFKMKTEAVPTSTVSQSCKGSVQSSQSLRQLQAFIYGKFFLITRKLVKRKQ